MWMTDVFDALSRALERGISKLIVLYAKASSTHNVGCGASQYNMLQPLKDAFPDNVHIFIRKDGVFVHSKMVIIDDVYTLIGSANIGYRSFTSDPELGAAVVGSATMTNADGRTVTRFANDVRVKSFAEIGNFSETE